MLKQIIYDTETTGVDVKQCAMHEISGLIVIDDTVVERFCLYMRPFKGATISKDALKVCNVSLKTLRKYPLQSEVFAQFKDMLSKYVDKYDKTDKFTLVGFHNRNFDDFFIRNWFLRNGDKYFGSYFWNSTIDVSVLAAEYLKLHRHLLLNFKLMTVATHLFGEDFINNNELHTATYDAEITAKIYSFLISKIDRPRGNTLII